MKLHASASLRPGRSARIHKDDAARIMREVRSFYAAGVKSGNKIYAEAPRNGYIDLDDPFDGYWQNWSTTMLANKAELRNDNALAAMQHRPKGPSKGGSYYAWGKSIYNGGKRAAFASGNCMEMAAVSAAIAIDDYHFAGEWLYMAMITAPGDHAFCVVSMRKPTWASADAMTGTSGASGAYVIDPWLHTACPAEEYWAAAQARVAKWSQVGKRIAWAGIDGNDLGWYDPQGDYAAAFGTSPLGFGLMTATL